MTLIDRARRAANYGRRRADTIGYRDVIVTIGLETHSAPIDTLGETVTSSIDAAGIVLNPRPRVRKMDAIEASAYGGGPLSASTGEPILDTYEVGPITPAHAGGGYTLAQLLPTPANPTQRALVKLEGSDEFTAGGELFEVIDRKHPSPQSVILIVRRTRQ
jgi:hypothetical protein